MPAEAAFDFTEQAFNQDRFRGDENLFVRFFVHPKLSSTKSAEEGRPIFDDREYIQIMQPGNKESIVMRPARDMDRQRFPKQYAAFKNNEGDYVSGTRLEEWPAISRSQAEELKYFNIRTVEQLVNMSDAQAQKLMGINALKTRAKAFLEVCGKSAEAESLAAALEERDLRLQQLESQLEALQEALAEVEED